VSPPPVLRIPTVHHVGDMQPSSKRTDSYEGAGLSVCKHPSSWRRIARGFVGGTTHRMTNPDAAFLDAHALDEAQRASVLAWAVGRGLAKAKTLWTISWDDCDDDGEERRSCCVFTTAKAAKEEAEEYEDQGVEIARSRGHVSTPALDSTTMQTRPALGDRCVIDLVLPLWAHEVHGLSAVWWADDHDPASLSAPRGVIRAEALSDWRIEPIGYDPDEDEDFDEDLDEEESIDEAVDA